MEGGWLTRRIDRILRDLPAGRLEPLLSARDRRTRRGAYRAAIAADGLDLDRLIAAAVRDGDLPIRTMCAHAAVGAAADPAQLRVLLVSCTALVRAEALRALIADGDLEVAEATLPDRHPLVRELAQAALRHAGREPAMHYRRLVTGEDPQPGAIAGLGETGVSDDAGSVALWLSHPRTRGRVEAIRALRRLGVIRPAELVRLLRDESAAVARQAVTALRRDVGALDAAVLEALLRPGNAAHVRFAGYPAS
jgi:hypothetical protein